MEGGFDIWYATSPDAKRFAVQRIALQGSSDPCDPEFSVTGASLVRLCDRHWRMYYQARQAVPPSPPNRPEIQFQTYSAISSGGINFTSEGVRFAVHSQNHSSLYGQGRTQPRTATR